jgi:hypothetical protein
LERLFRWVTFARFGASTDAGALALRNVLRDFRVTGKRLSQALAAVASESAQLVALVTPPSTRPARRILCLISCESLAAWPFRRLSGKTPWARDFDPLLRKIAPTFGTLFAGLRTQSGTASAKTARRLPEEGYPKAAKQRAPPLTPSSRMRRESFAHT